MSINALVDRMNRSAAIRGNILQNKPDYTAFAVSDLNLQREAEQFEAQQRLANVQTAAKNATAIKITKDDVARDERIRNMERKTRMAGKLASGAGMIGAGLILKNQKKDEKNPLLEAVKAQQEFWKGQFGKADTEIAAADTQFAADMEGLSKKYSTKVNSDSSKDEGSSTTDTVSSAPTSTKSSATLAVDSEAGGLDLSKLTDNDYNELGYAISSEAALNTDDEFGVAANILTRLNSGKYGSSIYDIIRAEGQYEGVYTGKSKYSPEIVARLKSPEGQQKIKDFYKQLDGRTEFKGQSQLGNRVVDEDPMFDPKGNFYHYSWQ